MIENSKSKCGLAEIDTPESAQPYGTRAKQELSRPVYGKTVIVKVQDTDRLVVKLDVCIRTMLM